MSDSDIIAKESQDLSMASDEAIVSLYELGLSTTLYFHAENTADSLVFDGNTYVPFPMIIEGIETTAEGAQNRPTLTLPNVESLTRSDSEIRSSISDFVLEDLVGVRITRRQTLEKYIGSSVSNYYEFPKAIYVIDRIASKNQLAVKLELSSPFDLAGVRVPSRQVTGKYCAWVYKGYTQSNTDVRSACIWTSELSSGEELYFTTDDEPLLLESLSVVTGAAAWNSSSTYNVEDLVTYDGLLYMAKSSVPANTTPTEVSIYWKICRTYSDWSSDTAGSKSYSVNTTDSRKSSYVYYNNDVYKCVRSHTKNTSIIPGTSRAYWAAGDVCGKLLSSCKCRYQAKLRTSGSSGTSGVPQVGEFNTQIALPFGGFPGTRKFR